MESDNQSAPGVADSWTHGIGSLARDQIRALVLFRIPHPLRGRRAAPGSPG
ncbi:hypothetical protein [Nostocoides sp. HKS02]|uniref:hypothetical protein n=1 Tax=Nostocoides sp. HKS02 TaxID=1813880 RepID=UPI001E5B1A8F|nr:hypothetical protein [Tetrasphaera sp. HKS02]